MTTPAPLDLPEDCRAALRAFRADESDLAAFCRLVVLLWRAGGLRSFRRSFVVAFRLRKDPGGSSLPRNLQSHPWAEEEGSSRKGTWWTVGPSWKEQKAKIDRPWITATPDTGRRSFVNANYCKRFDSIAELADYVMERASEWRVVELATTRERASLHLPPARKPRACPERIGPSRAPCGLEAGHEGGHRVVLGRTA